MRNAVAKWAAAPLTDDYWRQRRAHGHAQALRYVTRFVTSHERVDTVAAYGAAHPEVRV